MNYIVSNFQDENLCVERDGTQGTISLWEYTFKQLFRQHFDNIIKT